MHIVKPKYLMHPIEMVTGELSQVEYRVFIELALSAGGRAANVWIGNELSDNGVKEKLKAVATPYQSRKTE